MFSCCCTETRNVEEVVGDRTMPVLLADKRSLSKFPQHDRGIRRIRGEFRVHVVKSDREDGKLGLNVARLGEAVKIKGVSDGLVFDWNLQNLDREVMPRDKIVEVNGIRGTADELLHAIGTDRSLDLVITRICVVYPGHPGMASISEDDDSASSTTASGVSLFTA